MPPGLHFSDILPSLEDDLQYMKYFKNNYQNSKLGANSKFFQGLKGYH